MYEKHMYDWIKTREILKASQYTHISIVRSFIGWINDQAGSGTEPSPEHIVSWLRYDLRKRSRAAVIHRAHVIHWFLQWRTQQGLASNPVNTLVERHGVTRSKLYLNILRDDYEETLRKLRPRPLWTSAYGPLMKACIERRKALGFKCGVEQFWFAKFDAYLQDYAGHAQRTLRQLVDEWSSTFARPRARWYALQCGRRLSKEQRRTNPDLPLMEVDRKVTREAFIGDRKPHIFSESDIAKVLETACLQDSNRDSKRPPLVYSVLILLYCTGLRLGEATRLRLKDIDLVNNQLEIIRSKFNKSRFVPFSPSVRETLERYIAQSRAAGAPSAAESPIWWSPRNRAGYGSHYLGALIRAAFTSAGLKPNKGAVGPRPHDLRHTFVAHRMMQWYREGVDVQSRLPYLATYLGHRDISSTLVYITLTSELMQTASERFRRSVTSAACRGFSA